MLHQGSGLYCFDAPPLDGLFRCFWLSACSSLCLSSTSTLSLSLSWNGLMVRIGKLMWTSKRQLFSSDKNGNWLPKIFYRLHSQSIIHYNLNSNKFVGVKLNLRMKTSISKRNLSQDLVTLNRSHSVRCLSESIQTKTKNTNWIYLEIPIISQKNDNFYKNPYQTYRRGLGKTLANSRESCLLVHLPTWS